MSVKGAALRLPLFFEKLTHTVLAVSLNSGTASSRHVGGEITGKNILIPN
jgi:hypothetical protein